MAIDTLESLQAHLQAALQVEHSTIPPYLCALYSIKEGKNQEAYQVIQSVAMEEMLHMTLAANILNAVGGKPEIANQNFVPVYPDYLPHSAKGFMVNLEKFSKSSIKTFLKIEKPEKPGGKPEDDYFHTIGQFYDAVGDALVNLCKELGEENVFIGDKSRQVTPEYYYGGGGEVVVVTDLKSAQHAMEEIVEQGEGLDHSIFDGDATCFDQEEEPAHYFRFNEIYKGRYYAQTDKPHEEPSGPPFHVDWNAVYDMAPNPKAKDFKHFKEIKEAMDDFNRTYTTLLELLEAGFNGEQHKLLDAVGGMYELKYKAQALMRTPNPLHKGKTVGPSFEYLK